MGSLRREIPTVPGRVTTPSLVADDLVLEEEPAVALGPYEVIA